MRPKADPDSARLAHMLDAAREVLRFSRGKSRASLNKDRKLALALIKDIEILGEAASKVSRAFQARHGEIPWKAIVATRNRLIHGYFDVDLDIVWSTVSKDIRPLVRALLRILDSP